VKPLNLANASVRGFTIAKHEQPSVAHFAISSDLSKRQIGFSQKA